MFFWKTPLTDIVLCRFVHLFGVLASDTFTFFLCLVKEIVSLTTVLCGFPIHLPVYLDLTVTEEAVRFSAVALVGRASISTASQKDIKPLQSKPVGSLNHCKCENLSTVMASIQSNILYPKPLEALLSLYCLWCFMFLLSTVICRC